MSLTPDEHMQGSRQQRHLHDEHITQNAWQLLITVRQHKLFGCLMQQLAGILKRLPTVLVGTPKQMLHCTLSARCVLSAFFLFER
jgi:hypothetical protein